jgi:hypothetical protein
MFVVKSCARDDSCIFYELGLRLPGRFNSSAISAILDPQIFHSEALKLCDECSRPASLIAADCLGSTTKNGTAVHFRSVSLLGRVDSIVLRRIASRKLGIFRLARLDPAFSNQLVDCRLEKPVTLIASGDRCGWDAVVLFRGQRDANGLRFLILAFRFLPKVVLRAKRRITAAASIHFPCACAWVLDVVDHVLGKGWDLRGRMIVNRSAERFDCLFGNEFKGSSFLP